MILLIIDDLMIMEGSKDMRRSRLVVFNSLVSCSLRTPHKIETMIQEPVKPVVIQFHIDDGLHEIV